MVRERKRERYAARTMKASRKRQKRGRVIESSRRRKIFRRRDDLSSGA
jgi:hypothetical protein